jgi:hypothetical protein
LESSPQALSATASETMLTSAKILNKPNFINFSWYFSMNFRLLQAANYPESEFHGNSSSVKVF